MTLLDRSLSKAYGRTPTATVPAEVPVRAGPDRHSPALVPAAARGWVDELREPLQPTQSALVWAWPPICRKLLDSAGDGFRQLAEHVLQTAARQQLRSIALTGPGRRVGRTSILLALAQSLAENGTAHVLLVDADFAHPQLAEQLGLNPASGLGQMAGGTGSGDESLLTLSEQRLSLLLFAGSVDHAEAISTDHAALAQTLRPLKEQFDLILIDAGPWPNRATPSILNREIVDAVLGVAREGTAGDEELDREVASCREAGVEFLGIIETFTSCSLPC